MKKLLLIQIFIFNFLSCYSQNMAQPGTYQLMTDNVKSKEVFTTDLLVIIEDNRHHNEEVILKVGIHYWVRILPYNIINDPGFIPLSDEIVDYSLKLTE